MSLLISLSQNYNETNTFCKFLSVLSQMYAKKLPSSVLSKVGQYQDTVIAFAQENDLDIDNIRDLFLDLKTGKDVTDDDFHAEVCALALDLADNKHILSDPDISRDHAGIIKDFVLWIKKDSEPAYRRINQKVVTLKDPFVSGLFTSEKEHDQNSLKNRVEKLVKKLTGRADTNLTFLERKKFQGNETYKEFLKARGEMVKVYKAFLQDLVRSSGKPYLPIDLIRKELDANDILHTLPDGFVGNVDEKGNLYTTEGKKLISNPSWKVTMNPAYNAKKDNAYVCSGYPYEGAKQEQRYYTTDYRLGATEEKFDVVDELSEMAPKLRKKWLSKLSHGDVADRDCVMSLMAELVYLTTARVSARIGSTDGKETFGLTTWQIRHLNISPSKIIITYQGKKGVKQRHVILPADTDKFKVIYKMLKALTENKERKDFVFRVGNRRILSNDLNKFIRKLGAPEGTTIHKFRHLHAKMMTQEILDRNPFSHRNKKPTEAEVTKWLKSQLEQVGKKLGHISGEKVTPMTAINAYIAPISLMQFYKSLGLRAPTFVEKLLKQKRDED